MPRRLRRRGQTCAAAPSQRITFLDKCFERHPDGVQVFGHRPGGVVVTPGCNSFDYSFVFLVRLFLATCNKIECLGLPCQRFTDIDDYRLEDTIPTGFCNQSVKLGVECNPYERIVLVTHLLYQSAECCQFLRGVPLRSPSCGRNFDMRPCFDQFVGRIAAEIEVSRYRITDDERAELDFVSVSPRAWHERRASRITDRLTPCLSARDASDGRRSPTARSPEAIAARRSARTASAALTRAATGRLVAQLSDRFMPSLLRLPKSRVKHRTW